MASTEFDEFLDSLPHCWGNREGFIQRSEYIDKVRQSALTADQVAQLRDSLVQGQPGTPTGQQLDTIRAMLQGVYESKIRDEQKRSAFRLSVIAIIAAAVIGLAGIMIPLSC